MENSVRSLRQTLEQERVPRGGDTSSNVATRSPLNNLIPLMLIVGIASAAFVGLQRREQQNDDPLFQLL